MRLAVPWRSNPAPALSMEPAGYPQASRAVASILGRLKAVNHACVLDLGPPTETNLSVYAAHRAKITIADFYRFYTPHRRGVEGDMKPRLDEFLPNKDMRFDVILAWDLLNYLTADEIAWLMVGLSTRCAPAAMILALISCQGRMPEVPSTYSISDEQTLSIEQSGHRKIKSPAYSEQTLTRLLPWFSVDSRFQLRNSMVEYLLTYR